MEITDSKTTIDYYRYRYRSSIVSVMFLLKRRLSSKIKLSYMKSLTFRSISASINLSKSVTLLRGKRNKEKMSLSTSDC